MFIREHRHSKEIPRGRGSRALAETNHYGQVRSRRQAAHRAAIDEEIRRRPFQRTRSHQDSVQPRFLERAAGRRDFRDFPNGERTHKPAPEARRHARNRRGQAHT